MVTIWDRQEERGDAEAEEENKWWGEWVTEECNKRVDEAGIIGWQRFFIVRLE